MGSLQLEADSNRQRGEFVILVTGLEMDLEPDEQEQHAPQILTILQDELPNA